LALISRSIILDLASAMWLASVMLIALPRQGSVAVGTSAALTAVFRATHLSRYNQAKNKETKCDIFYSDKPAIMSPIASHGRPWRRTISETIPMVLSKKKECN